MRAMVTVKASKESEVTIAVSVSEPGFVDSRTFDLS